jgi:hypothetical protein
MQAIFERGCTEVDEQADWQMEQTEIGQNLFRMNRGKVLDRLQLHDHLSSTNRSTRNPSSKRNPSNSIEIGFCLSTLNCLHRSHGRVAEEQA